MAATESSVVVALKEVRRLELERQRREEETRRTQEEAARHGDGVGSASVQYGPGMAPFGANGWSTDGLPEGFPRHRTSEVMPVASQHGFPAPQSYVGQAPPAWEGPGFVTAPAKQRSVVGPVLLTAIVCGLGAFGFVWKTNGDNAAERTRMMASQQKLELSRNEAVAAREKAEQELKLKVAELEGKVNVASAKASAASAALAFAAKASASGAPAAAAAPLPAGPRAGLRKGRGFGRALGASAAKAPVAAAPLAKVPVPPVAPSPKVAKKKSLSDDPLGGLRL